MLPHTNDRPKHFSLRPLRARIMLPIVLILAQRVAFDGNFPSVPLIRDRIQAALTIELCHWKLSLLAQSKSPEPALTYDIITMQVEHRGSGEQEISFPFSFILSCVYACARACVCVCVRGEEKERNRKYSRLFSESSVTKINHKINHKIEDVNSNIIEMKFRVEYTRRD